MATPHSLPTGSTRMGAQLPFSPTPAGGAQKRLSISTRPHSGSVSANGPTSPRTPTLPISPISPVAVLASRSPQNMGGAAEKSMDRPSAPPSPSLPLVHPRPQQSLSHAGGILPSAAFFHPSRPNYPPSPTPRNSRPSSIGSAMSMDAPTFDGMRLAPLSEHERRESEASDSFEQSTEDYKPPGQDLASSGRSAVTKHSREPLLPIGRRPSRATSSRRPSVNTHTGPYGRSETNLNGGGRVRDSFEKLFKRGLSMEGSRKTPVSSPTATSGNALACRGTDQPTPTDATHMTFELNVARSPPPPQMRYKQSLSPTQASTSSLNPYSFIPTPPSDMKVPLAETPLLDPNTGKLVRNYRLHPSHNRFYLRGHILTGGDTPWAFCASLTVVLAIAGVWFGTTCVWWWLNESPAVAAIGAYMCLLTISSMLATAFRDPGILPRNLDPDPPFAANSSSESLRAPLPRDLKVRVGSVRTKYCPTCKTYRPPRSSHCKMCDNCVDGCDHHCQWVNNCVGRRNYTSFFTFLFSAVLTLVLVICTSGIHLYLATRKEHFDFRRALATPQGVGSAIAFSMSIVVIWPVMALLFYHLRLLLLNVTTVEQIRAQAHKPGERPPNPFSHGNWRRNLLYVLCRPVGMSWLEFPAVATEDKRELNPGFLQDSWIAEAEEGRGAKGE